MISEDNNRSIAIKRYQIEISSYPESEKDGFSSAEPLLDSLMAEHHTVSLAGKLYRQVYAASNEHIPYMLITESNSKTEIGCINISSPQEYSGPAGLLLTVKDMLSISLLWYNKRVSWIQRSVEITDGQGIIRIINDDQSNALIIEKPVAINWPDCRGSIGEYYAVSSYEANLRQTLTHQLDQVLLSGSNTQILDATDVFLRLFENGRYAVFLGEIKQNEIADVIFDRVSKKQGKDKNSFAANFYPFGEGWTYLATRPKDNIDADRVSFYEHLIRKGSRPKAVVYIHHLDHDYQYCNYYILDGHHKFMAYINLKIDPHVVHISKDCYGEKLSAEMLTAALSILNPHAFDHYLQNYSDRNLPALLSEQITTTLDKVLRSETKIDSNILENIRKAHTDPLTRDWAKQRLAVLATNKHVNKGLALDFPYQWPGYDYPAWSRFPINNKKDFEHWKEVFIDEKPLSAELENKLKPRVNRSYVTDTSKVSNEQPFDKKSHTVGSTGFTGREILLLIVSVLLLIQLMLNGC